MNGSILSCSSCECVAKHNLWINPEKNSCTKSLNNPQGAQLWNVNILLLNDEENLTLVFCFLLQFVQCVLWCVLWCVCDVCGVCVCAVNEQGWLDDEEFGRQRLAGINPMHIELLTVKICPLSFTLDRTVVLFGHSFLVQKNISKMFYVVLVQGWISVSWNLLWPGNEVFSFSRSRV